MRDYLELFWTFMKVGAFTFGGGWGMIPLIEREVVTKKNWMSKEEFIDALAVSQSLPGIIAVNISIIVGNKLKGTKGSIASTLGTVVPSFLIILIIAIFFSRIDNNPIVKRIFWGIRPAVVALIVAPVLSTAKSAKLNIRTIWIPIVTALSIWLLGVSPIYIIIFGALGGIAFCQIREQKKKKI